MPKVILTDEIVAAAIPILQRLGFHDSHTHSLNSLQWSKDVPNGVLTVWGRFYTKLLLEWGQDEERQVQVIETLDLPTLELTIVKTIQFLESIDAKS